MAAIAAIVFVPRGATPDLLVTRLDLVTPPTDDPFSFAVSPDGRAIAFAGKAAGSATTLWLRPFEQATARSLAGTEGASYPFWAPDSRTIGFLPTAN